MRDWRGERFDITPGGEGRCKADELLALKRSLRLKRLLPEDEAEGRSHVMTKFEPKHLDGERNPKKNGNTKRVLRRRFELVRRASPTPS